jgi:hypothetical protein
MRWMRLKLAAVLLAVPMSHLVLSRQFGHAYMVWEVVWQKTFISLAAFIVIAILGRLKPRLGQRYGAG